MSNFSDGLWQDLVREHSHALAVSEPHSQRSARRNPRLVAGSLGLAGVGAALAVSLASGVAAAPSFAVTRHGGQVSLELKRGASLDQVNQKLRSLGLAPMTRQALDGGPDAAGVPNCSSVPAGFKGVWERETGSYTTGVVSVSETAPAGSWVLVDCYSGDSAYNRLGYTQSQPNTSTTTTPVTGNTGS